MRISPCITSFYITIKSQIYRRRRFKMDNNLDSDKSNKENKSKKRYKLKSIINNLEIKVSLPEEEDKTKKDSNKKIQVF